MKDNTTKKILIVDDEMETRRLIAVYLAKRKKYETHEAANGIEALEFLTTIIPDLIILDVVMPGLDGFSVLKRLKSSSGYATIPVIMLTARSSPSDVGRGIALEADFYLPKPFQFSNLMKFIRLVLDNDAQ
ncbi:MAG: response regulator [Candidatus Omnitrophica bacterium]|nr:response regulator [Candidatus Omnitrophota bacterium]